MYFEIYKEGSLNALAALLGGANDWRWRLRAANHEIIAAGEGYANKEDCLHAIALVQGTTFSTLIHEL